MLAANTSGRWLEMRSVLLFPSMLDKSSVFIVQNHKLEPLELLLSDTVSYKNIILSGATVMYILAVRVGPSLVNTQSDGEEYSSLAQT